MTASLRKIALVGASGNLGPFILAALQSDPGNQVTIITRVNSKASFPASPHNNTTVVRVQDGYPEDEMVRIFKGHDAAVLSLGFAADSRHDSLARASAKAGVKRLIANSYGGPDNNEAAAMIYPGTERKRQIIEELRRCEKDFQSQGWSWTTICCGLFFDLCLNTGFFGISPTQRTATIWGTGNVQFSATTRANVGNAVAGVLALPEQTANRSVYISSFECSQNSIVAACKKASETVDTDWTLTYVDTDEMIAKGREEWASGNFWGLLKLALASCVREDCGQNFKVEGLLDNEAIGVKEENLEEVVKQSCAI